MFAKIVGVVIATIIIAAIPEIRSFAVPFFIIVPRRRGCRPAGPPGGSCAYEGVASGGGLQLSYGPAGPMVVRARVAGARWHSLKAWGFESAGDQTGWRSMCSSPPFSSCLTRP